MSQPDPTDPYSRLDYRRLIAWPARIEREWPLLEAVLEDAPSRRVLDLGCGTGEHARFLAEKGFEVLAIDRSAAMIEALREVGIPAGLTCMHGDLTHLGELLDDDFGAAICLGNTLPHLLNELQLGRMLDGLRRHLLPGGAFLLQLLNYRRIADQQVRHLPLNFRPDPDGDGELVFLRLMETRDDGMVRFCPTTLRYRGDRDPPVELLRSRNVLLKGWQPAEVDAALADAGFAQRDYFGGVDRQPFDPAASHDLVAIAR
ncbi:MAG: class I SAM-dependent methyltransferase [Acidobacteria bacterium]|nr:MAG: class I SAM-dependent methyltransferase [Acidobacteriota bacterium]